MKNFKLIITIIILSGISYSCNNSAVQRMMEDPERSVGMSTWEGVEDMKWHLGTQDAIEVVKTFNNAWQSRDYETLRSVCSDTVQFTSGNGKTNNIDEFVQVRIDADSRRDSLGATFTWKSTNLFSVDLDPTFGGEHVNVYVDAEYTEGDLVDRFRAINHAYVIDGKIVRWGFYGQDIIDESPDLAEESEEETEE
jgi:hypothetical protein|tara:strand:+ start:73 stop:657 length:585 start_codon:yes stop_codon:yes gene_type:complete